MFCQVLTVSQTEQPAKATPLCVELRNTNDFPIMCATHWLCCNFQLSLYITYYLCAYVYVCVRECADMLACVCAWVCLFAWAKACAKTSSPRLWGTCYSFTLVFILSPLCSDIYIPHLLFYVASMLTFFIFFLSQSSCKGHFWNSLCLLKHHLFNSRFVLWFIFLVSSLLCWRQHSGLRLRGNPLSDGRAPSQMILQCP